MSSVLWMNTVMVVATAMLLLLSMVRMRANQIVPVLIPVDGHASDGTDRQANLVAGGSVTGLLRRIDEFS